MPEKVNIFRVVLDTNVFLRALIREGNVCHKIVELWKDDQFLIVTSKQIIQEVGNVLKRPFLLKKYGYSLNQVDKLIELIDQKAIFVEPGFSLELCRDKHDDKFIDCAILGRVKHLVSEDKDIFDDKILKKQLLEYGIAIKNAHDFYQEIIHIYS